MLPDYSLEPQETPTCQMIIVRLSPVRTITLRLILFLKADPDDLSPSLMSEAITV